MWEPFVLECVIRPSYLHLERGYEEYKDGHSKPCHRKVPNQCAVRMSIALGRAGFGLESFSPRERVHSGNGACGTNGIPHVLAALELANFLDLTLFSPRVFPPARGRGCADAFAQIRGSRGIIYFNNCFTREGESTRQGDHIDLFNGRQYYNQILRPQAGGDELAGDLFGRADRVRFWELRD